MDTGTSLDLESEPGEARTCFPTQRNGQMRRGLFLCCSGRFGEYSVIQGETSRDVSAAVSNRRPEVSLDFS